MRAHDLLQISGLADLVYVGWDLPEKRCPLWVERSLERAPFVVVRRANLFDGMIPVGVRGSSRQQRSAAYLAPKSIRNRITPEQPLLPSLPSVKPLGIHHFISFEIFITGHKRDNFTYSKPSR
jgi:hypothetical protein